MIFTSVKVNKPSDVALVLVENPKECFNIFLKQYVPRSIPFIHRCAVLSSKATIGKYCAIESGVVIRNNVQIGDNCVIMANTVIGGSGFGHTINLSTGEQMIVPHIGGVKIGNNVRIGSNTCIDRGTLGDTVIKDNVRIDNLVHIAHNVKIGKNSMIVANCMIAGSVQIGDDTWVGPSTSVLNQLSIGSDAYIGMAACVTKSIPDDVVAYGFPARVK